MFCCREWVRRLLADVTEIKMTNRQILTIVSGNSDECGRAKIVALAAELKVSNDRLAAAVAASGQLITITTAKDTP